MNNFRDFLINISKFNKIFLISKIFSSLKVVVGRSNIPIKYFWLKKFINNIKKIKEKYINLYL